jgi:hypothetical protein
LNSARLLILVSSFLCWDSATALVNPSFELPVEGSTGYAYSPTGSGLGWTFAPGSGVSGKNSAFTSDNGIPSVSSDAQVAFLQNYGYMYQYVSLDAGTYAITLSAAQRGGPSQSGTQVVLVQFNGSTVGSFTPSSSGDLQNYETSTFSVPSAGSYLLLIGSAGSGTDYTSLVDDVAISRVSTVVAPQDVGTTSSGSPCSLAHFYDDFNHTGDQLAIEVLPRLMGLVANTSTYTASTYTLVADDGCAKGPNATSSLQSTFQQRGTEVGFFMLSPDFNNNNPHAAYSTSFSTPTAYWVDPGDSVVVTVDARAPLISIAGSSPLAQFYVIINAIDPNGNVLQYSVIMYDSRTVASTQCDNTAVYHVNGSDRTDQVEDSFAAGVQASCTSPIKGVWIPVSSGGLFGGDSGPNNGAWDYYVSYEVRLTREELQTAINDANGSGHGCSPKCYDSNPSNYNLNEVGILQENSWSGTDQIDTASSVNNFTVKRYKSY